MKFVRKNYKVIVGIIIGIVLTGSITYAASITSKDVEYSNSSSGLTSTNMQGAIDEVYTKANSCSSGAGSSSMDYVVNAYTYNSSSCVTGEEKACVATDCYKSKSKGSCPAGTIIKYKVNDYTEKYFNVLHDDGDTITMQQREDTVSTLWYPSADNTNGPTKALYNLEAATIGWLNVENQTYVMGTTVLYDNAFTSCTGSSGEFLSCTSNKYTLESRTVRARMITVQEATALGCKYSEAQSCPNWMNNYTQSCTNYGGTVSKNNISGYWTMQAMSTNDTSAFAIGSSGSLTSTGTSSGYMTARAVVVINK